LLVVAALVHPVLVGLLLVGLRQACKAQVVCVADREVPVAAVLIHR
jgi:hypothetical protein